MLLFGLRLFWEIPEAGQAEYHIGGNVNKHPFVRPAIIAVAAFLATLLFILPGALRVKMVVALGVLTANTLTGVMYVGGGLLAAIALTITALTVRRAVISQRAIRTASEKALAKSQYKLPGRTENNPDVVRKHLAHVAEEYPDIAVSIKALLDQLQLLQQHLGIIRTIFRSNPGLLTQTDTQFESAKFEVLLERVIEEASTDLVAIVYLAFARSGDASAPIRPLLDAIAQVNRKNQARVNQARALSDKAAIVATDFEKDNYGIDATKQVQELIMRLDATNGKKVF